MQRAVFDRSIIDGYRTSKTESIAVTLQGRRMFSGTSDGSVVMYETKLDTVGSTRISCAASDTIRKPKDKKPVVGLLSAESWRTLIGIVDGVLSAFDTQFPQNVTAIADQKGCHCFAINEQNRTLVIANKKKLIQYAWQAPGFALVREFTLPDVPKSLLFVRNAVILGYRKHYECMDLVSGLATRILDVEREHRMLITEMAANIFRPAALLLSLGLQGVVLELDKVLAGTSFAYGSTTEERLEWGGLPVFCSVLLPFVVSCLPDSVEIHDLASLVPLQRITISTLGAHEISFCSGSLELSTATQQFGFVCNGEELSLLKMIPIAKQVDELAARGLHEDAIHLYSLCAAEAPDYVKGIDVHRLHEACANALLQKGDFDKAVKHYIDGAAEFVSVVRQFPDLVPVSMHPMVGLTGKAAPIGPPMAGAVLQRAATAVVHFCDYHRPKVLRRAQRAESLKELGILDTSMASINSSSSAALYYGSGLNKGGGGVIAAAAPASSVGKDDEDDEYITDPDEEIRRAQLLDTVLLFALVSCQPPRRNATVQLLSSGSNYCQVETCSVLLASQGNPFTEALLWLYRSHGLHSRVLDALKEDKSVAVGGWNRDQFYLWAADYLRWLWYHESDAALPRLALFALKPLLEYDAELGLSVLLCRPPPGPASSGSAHISSLGRTSFGGKGLTIPEVLAFLRTVNPRSAVRRAVPFGAVTSGGGAVSATTTSAAAAAGSAYSKYAHLQGSAAVQAVVACTPLICGHALGVAFLECIVSTGEAPANMHDEFVQLLVEGLDVSPAQDLAAAGVGAADDADMANLRSIYRRRLQAFLLASSDYHPQRVLQLLAPAGEFVRETALVESRLGEHQSVLFAYVHRLHDMRLAEWYCDRVYTAFQLSHTGSGSTQGSRSTSGNDPARMSFSAAIGAGSAAGSNNGNSVAGGGSSGGAAAAAGSAGLNVLVKRDEGIISGLREAGDIYLILFKVLLMDSEEVQDQLRSLGEDAEDTGQDQQDAHTGEENAVAVTHEHHHHHHQHHQHALHSQPPSARAAAVIALAEKYFDRVDAAQLLELLPEDTAVAALLRYFQIVLEYGSAQRRNLQIIHQLLRVREVQIRTNN